MSKSFSLSKPVLFSVVIITVAECFIFCSASLSLSLLISFIFSILLCFGVIKRGPYHHLFCVIRSVIVLFRFAVRFCRSHIHSVRVDSVRSGVARATIQTYRLTFPPLFMASMPRFRQKSKHKNDRETRIGSHTHTHTEWEKEACFSLDNHYCFRLWYSCGSYIFNLFLSCCYFCSRFLLYQNKRRPSVMSTIPISSIPQYAR